MSSSTFAEFTKVIVDHLRRLDHDEQRVFFAALLVFVRRESGGQFDSVTDFLSTESEAVPIAERERILACVCRALADGSLSDLEATT